MTEELLGIAAKPLLPLAKAAAGHIRVLSAERKAAVGGSPGPADLMGEVLRGTWARLVGPVDDAWWRSVLDAVEQAYVAPDFLKMPALQKWLRSDAVPEWFMALAKANVMGVAADDGQGIRNRLGACYADVTGEAEHFAEGPIDVVLAVLIAGYIATIPDSERATAGMIQQVDKGVKRIEAKLDDVARGPRFDPVVQHVHDKEAQSELSDILTQRTFDPSQATERIQELHRQTEDGGELAGATDALKNRVRYWTARLCATTTESLATAQRIRKGLSERQTEESLLVVDAWIAATSDKGDEAMRLIRDVDDPDCRTVFVSLLARLCGEAEALAWCIDVDPTDLPTHFTHGGCGNWAVHMARAGRWEDAARGLREVERHHGWEPRVALVEGTVNAAFLLPEERRSGVLDSIPFYLGVGPSVDAAAEQHRERAAACFEYVGTNLGAWANKDLSTTVDDWRLWLRLMSPIRAENDEARHEIQSRMKNGVDAVHHIAFAWAFGIEFDDGALCARLRQSRRLGGMSDAEVVAECLLNDQTMDAGEFAGYVELHMERLDRVLPESTTTAMLFHALLSDAQTERAREWISTRSSRLDPSMVARMNAALDAQEGTDPRRQLEELYLKSGSVVDLRNLIAHLRKVDDRRALGQRLRKLFELDRTIGNAHELVAFLSHRAADHAALLMFLDEYPNLAEQNKDICGARAWALFHAGRLSDARAINERLLTSRANVDDLRLDVQLAIAAGDWGRLTGVVEREWPRRQHLGPDVLMMLAWVARHPGQLPERALELAALAAAKAPEDPGVLASAYGLHFELGHDDQADPEWLAQAVKHSSEDEGPIWRTDLKELVDQRLPAMRERNERIIDMLFKGDVPIGIAAGTLNLPLSRVLLDGRRNGRERPVIPILSGVRRPVELEDQWTVGLDLTSILVLGHVGLLETTIDALGHVEITHDAMATLYAERDAVRFHQPALVQQAKQIRRLFDRNRINVVEDAFVSNTAAVEEFGIELAMLLEACREEAGVMICVEPLHKAHSLMEELADTSAYEDLIFSPADLCAVARKRGFVDAQTYKRAKGFLASQDQEPRPSLPDSMLNGPVYVDEPALSYLQSAHVLDVITSHGVDIRVHPNVRDMANALVEAGDAGDDLANEVERLVAVLRKGMECGAVSLLPQLSDRREKIGRVASVASLEGFVLAAERCQALCVDDRYMNSHPACAGPTGASVPVVCVLDLLRHLRSRNVISNEQCWTATHELRDAGFVFVPVDADELRHWLEDVRVDAGEVVESPELRTIRQTINTVESNWLADERELWELSAAMQLVNAQVIRELWANTSIDDKVAEALCTWVWCHLAATTYLFKRSELGGRDEGNRDSIVRRIALVFVPPMMQSAERRAAYGTWVGRCIVGPLRPANADMVEDALRRALSMISSVEEHRELVGKVFLDCLPATLRDQVARMDPAFASDCGLHYSSVIGLGGEGGEVQLAENELIAAASAVLEGSASVQVIDLSGVQTTVERVAGGETLCVKWTGHIMPMPALGLLCQDSTVRQQTLKDILNSLGPTARLPSSLVEQVAVRSLSPDEMSLVFNELSSGVAPLQGRLAQKVAHGKSPTFDEVAPPTLEYWERFCGPRPESPGVEAWLRERLIPYRRELLERDLAGGLSICCSGALRDDLSPGAWLIGFDDDAVWGALQMVEAHGNPIALLGALDVALYRVRQERFREFAADAIATLLDDSMRVDGCDVYKVFEVLCELEMNSLSAIEGGASCPGHWRRMCAWMQAGLVTQMLIGRGAALDVDALERACVANATWEGALRRQTDIRDEPLFISDVMGARNLRREILGRLWLLKQRHEKAGCEVPMSEEIESALARSDGAPSNPRHALPGPCELHLRPQEPMPEGLADQVSEMSCGEDYFDALNTLAWWSQWSVVEARHLAQIGVGLRDVAGRAGEAEFDDVLPQLHLASIVAAAAGSECVADGVAVVVGRLAPRASKAEHVAQMVTPLLRAAAAHRTVDDWTDWLDEKLTEFARALPARPSDGLNEFDALLQGLEVVLPMESWFHLGAKRVAATRR